MKAGGFLVLLAAAGVLALSSIACCCSVPAHVGERLLRLPWTTIRGSGNVIKVSRDVAGFTGVSLRGEGRVTIEQGQTESLWIEAEDNIIAYLETWTEGTTLVIDRRPGVWLRPTRTPIFHVTLQELEKLEVSGSGDAEADGIQTDRLSIVVSGSGNASLSDLEADGMRATISGSGNVDVSGATDEQEITISGSGQYRAGGLDSAEAVVRVSGSGSVTVRVSDRLDATVSGSGSVRYAGSPAVESRVTGSGSVRQIGE